MKDVSKALNNYNKVGCGKSSEAANPPYHEDLADDDEKKKTLEFAADV